MSAQTVGPRRAQAGQALARPVDVGQPQRRAVLGEQRGDAHGAPRIVAARSIARGVPLLSSSAATGSRQRPDAASAIASGSMARRCAIAHGSGRERFSRSVVAAPVSSHPVAGVGGDLAREQGDHELLRRDARARRVQRAGQPAHGSGRQLEAVDAGQRGLQVAQVAADDRLGVLEVVGVAQRGERAVLRDQARVQARQRRLQAQAAAHEARPPARKPIRAPAIP